LFSLQEYQKNWCSVLRCIVSIFWYPRRIDAVS
jgi:hypothetical protein